MTEIEAKALSLIQSNLVTAEARLFDHLMITFRWLMATLFAANGGAILAMSGSSPVAFSATRMSLGWFAAGLILSISMGILSGLWSYRASTQIIKSKLKVDQSLIEGVLDPSILQNLYAVKLTWKTWVPSYAGLASLVCLIIGILNVGGPPIQAGL